MNAEDAYLMIKNGANLVQIYSLFIFEGPDSVYKLNKKIDEFLEQDGLKSIADAVGLNIIC